MIVTYNQIIKQLNDFADAHKQVQVLEMDTLEVVQHNQLPSFNYPFNVDC